MNPELISFNDKILWLLKNDRNPLIPACCDKIKVKDYIKEKIGEGFTPKTYMIASSYNELVDKIHNDPSHPSTFFIKANNDSGGTVLVDNGSFDKSKLYLIEKHRYHPYGQGKGEWFYAPIKYQCFTEEKLGEELLIDYKFHCSAGTPRFCQVIRDRHLGNGRKEISVDMEGNILDFHFEADRQLDTRFDKPKNWQLMVDIATMLSQDFKYVRVDLYNSDINDTTMNSLFVGELTFAPRAGKTPGPGQVEAGKLLIGV